MVTILIVSAVIAVLVGVDQMIKLWAIANLKDMPAQPFLQIGSFDWMHLRYLENSGAAFSMLSGSRLFLIVFPVVMISACMYILHRMGKTHRWLYFAMPLIAGGGLGNLIDRIIRDGKVVDYLDFQLCRFAVFNFADICVTVGVFVVVIAILFIEKDEPEAKKLKQAKRVPYAPTVVTEPEADLLPDAGELPEAPLLPEADALPDASQEQDHA